MSRTPTVPGLSRLLGDSQYTDFLRDFWEKDPLLVRGGLGGDAQALFTLDAFANLPAGGPAGSLSVVTAGTARPLDDTHADTTVIFDAYADGCTLLASRVERQSPPVAELCRELDLDLLGLGVPLARAASANAYLTPARSRGFDLHYDDHCAFVVQLRGRKEWQVFAPVDELPTQRCDRPLPREDLADPLIDTSLEPGDVLYLPRGFPHWASTGPDSSLHLTLSLQTVTWADAIGEMCRAAAPFRRSIPPAAPDPAAAADYLEHTLKPALATLELNGYREHRVARGLAGLAPLAGDRFSRIDAVPTIDEDTPVQRVPRMRCLSTREDGAATLRFPGATVRLHPVMAPVFDFLAATAEFRPRDLPAVDATYDRVDLTRLLVTRGLLSPSRNGTAGTREPAGRSPGGAESTVTARPPARDLRLVRRGGPLDAPHLDWLSARRRLTDDECDEIIETCRAFPEMAPTTVSQDRYPDHRRVASREVGPTARTGPVFDLIRGLAGEAAAAHYRFSLTGIVRPPQYLEYHPGNGHFERHNDYSHDQAVSPRKVTVIVQLSAPDDYDGGELRAYGVEPEILPRERGSLIVFPSFLYHSVAPVTRGLRRALVGWVAGPRIR